MTKKEDVFRVVVQQYMNRQCTYTACAAMCRVEFTQFYMQHSTPSIVSLHILREIQPSGGDVLISQRLQALQLIKNVRTHHRRQAQHVC